MDHEDDKTIITLSNQHAAFKDQFNQLKYIGIYKEKTKIFTCVRAWSSTFQSYHPIKLADNINNIYTYIQLVQLFFLNKRQKEENLQLILL